MSERLELNRTARRQFLNTSGKAVAATALTSAIALPGYTAGSDNINVALVGCGGRGTGAAANALATQSGPIRLVAMADVFKERLAASYEALKGAADKVETGIERRVGGFAPSQVDVPPERRFLGFDAYQKAMDCLKPGDEVILTTPVAFRWVHFRYAIEYTFGDGTKLFLNSRYMPGCRGEFASYAHGTKGMAVISTFMHTPAKCRIYRGQEISKANLERAFPQPEPNPYQLEWDHLIEAIRQDRPFNEVKRGAEAALVVAMGRKAVHTGQTVTFEEMLLHRIPPHPVALLLVE